MHAELASVFEGCRKFEAELKPGLESGVAREVQHKVAKLEKSREGDSQVLPAGSIEDAVALLKFPEGKGLSANDYHIDRRPGEVKVVRWLEGDGVESFYERLQAHFDAALDGEKEDERQASEWKKDAGSAAYLEALEGVKVDMAERYLRPFIVKHGIAVLSTQTADEINIAYLCDYIMGVSAVELVGKASAPPGEPTEQDLAWFFKLFLLRGMSEGVERMLFFAFLQKTDDAGGDW